MLKNIIVLPDGTEVSSGSNHVNAIQSVTLTQSVNNSEELTLGSACAAMLEAKLITPGGGLDIAAGTEIALYKQDDVGTRHKIGLFTLEKPTRPTAGAMKLVGYDRVTKLDKDLTAWLAGLDGWPYRLIDFAGMVCEACGLALADGNILNADFPVQALSQSAVTGRQLMSWIGEICCRFVRANADGEIELAWYEPSDAAYAPSGENFFHAGSLSYETYQTAPIDMVQLRLANSDSGALYPEAEEGANSYIITGNPILTAAVTEDLLPYLEVIWEELEGVSYTPCTVSVPATVAVNAGDIIHVTNKNGVEIGVYVMEKVTAGQKTTLKCTGSQRRDSASAVNNRTPAQVAQNAVNNQTQKQIFDKLTGGGAEQGLFLKDGKLYLNGTYIMAKTFTSKSMVYLPPGEPEIETIKNHILDLNLIPDEKIPLYDADGNGEITITDLVQFRMMALGMKSIADWPGAIKTEITATMDVSDPDRAIIFSGRNMWGRKVEIWFGLNGTNIGRNHGDFSVTGNLFVGDAFQFGKNSSGAPVLALGSEDGKKLSWKDNGDGTFTLIGTEV